MMFSIFARSLQRSSRPTKNVLVYGRSFLGESFPQARVSRLDGNVGFSRNYLAAVASQAKKIYASKVHLSDADFLHANLSLRRFFSSDGTPKKNYENYYPKDKKPIPKGDDRKSNSEEDSDADDDETTIASATIVIPIEKILIFLFVLGLFFLYAFGSGGEKEISFQDFRNNLLEPGLVDNIVVANKLVAKVYVRNSPLDQATQGRGSGSNASQYKYYFNIGSVKSFEEKLQQAQEDLGIDPHDHVPVIYRSEVGLIYTLLATTVALLILGTMYLTRKIISGLSVGGKDVRGLFSMKKAHIVKADKNAKNKVYFKDVAGCDEAKQEIMEFVHFLKNPKKYEELGAKIPKGALLVGPPGTGKTLLAKATAGESDVPFLSISGSDFMEMFVGVGASRVRNLFQEARKCAPSIIFIDEIDAIGRARGRGGFAGSNEERESTLNQLLVEMDGFGTTSGVVVLAGTNRPDILDKALFRPGAKKQWSHWSTLRELYIDRIIGGLEKKNKCSLRKQNQILNNGNVLLKTILPFRNFLPR